MVERSDMKDGGERSSMPSDDPYVTKRDGSLQVVNFEKIVQRIESLCYGLDKRHCNPRRIAQKVINGLRDNMYTSELDELAADTCAYSSVQHPDFGILAARILVSNLHKKTQPTFSAVMSTLFDNGRLALKTHEVIVSNAEVLDAAIVHENDFTYDFFAFKTLERSYLMRASGNVVERPQYMLMRVCVGIHGEDIPAVLESYNLMSRKLFTHATPTLFNAGTPRDQLSSCFLLPVSEDSVEGILGNIKDCGVISKYAGGIGLSISNIRSRGSIINNGIGAPSGGVVPMMRVYNELVRFVDQDRRRPASIAMYLEPWHADVMDFLEVRKNNGVEDMRTRNLFQALWVNDLFMERTRDNQEWSLFSPSDAPLLVDLHGEAFRREFERLEASDTPRTSIPAQKVWESILRAQIETGMPYMLYKDACNAKSNQKNLGTIRSSNLCTEIVQFSSAEETAVCNLASVALNRFASRDAPYDFAALAEVVGVMTRNLNRVIDVGFYALESSRRSNTRHRPIGLGVQGLADVFILMRLPFDCPTARALNRDIFETIYFASLDASCSLAERDGPYESYPGSPVSEGILQFDMWGESPNPELGLDWPGLRARIAEHGVRNSLLVAPMPTASTSQILGNNECFEPYTNNVYTRRVLSGEYIMMNRHLVNDLVEAGVWDDKMRDDIMRARGSVASVPRIPADLRAIYRTSWEISQKSIVDMAADRAPFIDQSQSMNIHMEVPTTAKLTSMHFHAWKRGLKTGMYYLRTRPAAAPQQFTVSSHGEDDEDCLACGS